MQTIVVLNFGEEHAKTIAEILGKFGFRGLLRDYEIKAADIKQIPHLAGIVFSGGPQSVLEADAEQVDPEIFTLGLPMLGICYGMHLMVKHLGGKVVRQHEEEGTKSLAIHESGTLFKEVPNPLGVWMGHQDQVGELPDGFRLLASTENCPIAGAENKSSGIYLVQFHPERPETQNGSEILEAFAHVCS